MPKLQSRSDECNDQLLPECGVRFTVLKVMVCGVKRHADYRNQRFDFCVDCGGSLAKSELRLLAETSFKYRRQMLAFKEFFSDRGSTVDTLVLDSGFR